MAKKDDDFLKKLLATFKVEADEHLKAITKGLLELEKSPADETRRGIVETVFREAHSLKGAARSVNLTEVESACQSLESVLSLIKKDDLMPPREIFDVFHNACDALRNFIFSDAREKSPENLLKSVVRLRQFEERLKGRGDEEMKPVSDVVEGTKPQEMPRDFQGTGTLRVSSSKLDSLLLQSEEFVAAKLTAAQNAYDLQETERSFSAWKKQWIKMHSNAWKKEGSSEIYEWNDRFVKTMENQLLSLKRSANQHVRSLVGMVDSFLQDVKKVSMLPFSSLLETFPKTVRDLSREQRKDVDFIVQGDDIEVDKRILDEMKDPLMHCIRNCVDHGIEKPSDREQKKKPARGTLRLFISPKNGSKIEVVISDDGAGIDVEKVKSAALKASVISEKELEDLSEKEIIALVFQSGVSTSAMITNVSGRGLGLAILREKVEKLGGLVFVETEKDKGTEFKMVLPLTLASFRGIPVRVGEHIFIIATTSVERVIRIKREDIQTVENRETLSLNGKTISVVRLRDVLELPQNTPRESSSDYVQILVLGSAEKRIAFLVDEVLGEQEVIVKNLGRQLSRVRNISGATVLGNGKVVPVLNVPDVLKSAVKAGQKPAGLEAAGVVKEIKRKSILVAEDSITARMLLKNILEAAGYQVTTAVDGVDALTQLKMNDFDCVVSDVEMPRMDGFELTAKLRADKKLSELPVILVTALETREHKERGIDVGASAYIVKSSFDQSNLLEVMRRLI